MRRYFNLRILLIGIFLFSALRAAELHDGKFVKIVQEGSQFRLGVVVKTLDSEKLQQYQLKGGVEVVKVFPNSAAAEAGLKKGDIIVQFEGKTIAEAAELREKIAEIEGQKEIKLNVLREGKTVEMMATLKKHESSDEDYRVHINSEDLDLQLEELKELPRIIKKSINMISPKGGYLGIRGRTLSDQLKAYFGVENGVLIEEIIEDSPGDSVGLKAGDVITQIETKKIEDYGDLIRSLNYYDSGDVVNIKYVRKGKEKETRVKLDAKSFPHHPFKWPGHEEEIYLKDLEDLHIEHEKMRELEEELKNIKLDIDIYFI